MNETPREISGRESLPPVDASERFHFWLITTMLTLFILLLFYSQKTQGLM